MEWVNVTYRNRIVQNLNGTVHRGEFVAIMGPSGSGKTYTLDILSGRRTALVKGVVKVDGKAITRENVKRICLVQQTDAFFENLTLMQTINFAARLRLGTNVGSKHRDALVEKVIKLLNLESCCDIQCGDGERYGLSGGERKRLNLACEILCNPEIILLDEPTSGLDASAAKKLILFLRDFAVNENKIVICAIHQPSSFIFQCFHKVLVLHEGSQMFFGSPDDSIKALSAQGFVCPPQYNPAEFFLDILTDEKFKIVPDVVIVDSKNNTQTLEPNTAENAKTSDDPSENKGASLKSYDRTLDKGYATMHSTKTIGELEIVPKAAGDNSSYALRASYLTQVLTLGSRSFAHRWNKVLNKYSIIEIIAVTLFMCIIWFKVGNSVNDIERRKAQFYFLTQYWAFYAPYKVMFSFPSERQIVRRERSSGWYSLSAYYLGKCVVEIPLICIYPVLMVSVVYWVSGMADVNSFVCTLIIIVLTVIEFNALGVAIGCTTMVYQHTLTLCAICLLMMLMFGGFYSRQLPDGFKWTRYFSLFNYTWYALLQAHFNTHPYYRDCDEAAGAGVGLKDCNGTVPVSKDEILADSGVDLNLFSCLFIMTLSTSLFYLYGYLALKYLNKPNKEKKNV